MIQTIFATIFSSILPFSLGQELDAVATSEFKKIIEAIEFEKRTLLPFRAESKKSFPDKKAHQWHRVAWFGGSNYVVEFGDGVPESSSLDNQSASTRYQNLLLGNGSYFAFINKKSADVGEQYTLDQVEEKLDRGFPHATHPVIDSKRVRGLFDCYSDLLQTGEIKCSFKEPDKKHLMATWNGQKFGKPVSIELEFDLKHSRCTRQLISFPPKESTEISFEYEGEDLSPFRVRYSTKLNQRSYEERFDITKMEKIHNKSEVCYLSHYGLPEPPFFRHSQNHFWQIGLATFGVMTVAILLFWRFWSKSVH